MPRVYDVDFEAGVVEGVHSKPYYLRAQFIPQKALTLLLLNQCVETH